MKYTYDLKFLEPGNHIYLICDELYFVNAYVVYIKWVIINSRNDWDANAAGIACYDLWMTESWWMADGG